MRKVQQPLITDSSPGKENIMIIADETKLKYDEVNDVFSDESLALSEDSVNEAWEQYVLWSASQGE